MDEERQITLRLRELQTELNVKIIDLIGSQIRTTQAWCEHADCFFAIWGASLSKYRWACNKPGLVVTSRWNLVNRDDLHIYDSSEFMEEPSPLAYVHPDMVEDLPDAPLLVKVGRSDPSFFNFSVDVKQVFLQLRPIIQQSLDTNLRKI